jgi:hypothetical protein
VPKITDKPLEMIQVRLFKEDLDALRALYAGNLGVNKAIRTIVHVFVAKSNAEANKAIDASDEDMAELLEEMEITDVDNREPSNVA